MKHLHQPRFEMQMVGVYSIITSFWLVIQERNMLVITRHYYSKIHFVTRYKGNTECLYYILSAALFVILHKQQFRRREQALLSNKILHFIHKISHI